MDEGPFQNSTIHSRVVPTYAVGAGPVPLWERGVRGAVPGPAHGIHWPPILSGAICAGPPHPPVSVFWRDNTMCKDKEGVY